MRLRNIQAVMLTTTGMETAIRGANGVLVEEPQHEEPAIYGPFASQDEAIADARSVMGKAAKRGIGLTLLVADFMGDGTWGYCPARVTGNHVRLHTGAEAIASVRRAKGDRP